MNRSRGKTTRNQRRRKLFIGQKLMGLCLLAISAVLVWMALGGVTVEERDITAVLLFLPLGLYLIFSKQILIV